MLNAVVESVRVLHDGLRVVRVRYRDRAIDVFEPGQFVILGLPAGEGGGGAAKLVKRAYSICSSPGDRGALEFLIVRVDDGGLTPRLWELSVGDELWMDERVRGEFTLSSVPVDANIVMVATGTGVAPFVSMLRDERLAERVGRVALLHGARTTLDLAYHDELTRLAERNPAIRYVPILSRESGDSAWAGLRGRVQSVLVGTRFEQLAGFAIDAATTHVMLCGNPEMIRDVTARMESRGMRIHRKREPGTIHAERYW